MPIQTHKLSKATAKEVYEKINDLLSKKILLNTPENSILYKPEFCMPIQIVPKKQVHSLKFGKPEGFRILIQNSSSVLAMADFLYHKRKLKLTSVYQGKGINKLLMALNRLEKKYKTSKLPCYPELIYFLLAPGVYVKVTWGKRVAYYHFHHDRLYSITADRLQKQVSMIIKNHQVK